MNQKKAKALRRNAAAADPLNPIGKYKKFKLIYKALRKRGMIVTEKDLS